MEDYVQDVLRPIPAFGFYPREKISMGVSFITFTLETRNFISCLLILFIYIFINLIILLFRLL